MNVQIEVTTRCNFDCFYCTGRIMPQLDMSFDMFKASLHAHMDKYPMVTQQTCTLQGEGEPTLNKSLFKMAEYARSCGFKTRTTTNGTFKYPQKIAEHFDVVTISVDSLNEKIMEENGRHNLTGILKFIVELRTFMTEIFVSSVTMSGRPNANKDLSKVRRWAMANRVKHISQELRTKEDYYSVYGEKSHLAIIKVQPKYTQYTCNAFIPSKNQYRFYNVNGVEQPCCFIKNLHGYKSVDDIKAQLDSKVVPFNCTGCPSLR